MTARVQSFRSSTTGIRPSTTRPVGELFVNLADNALGVMDATPAPRDLLPVRYHSVTANYAAAAIVQQAGGLFQAKAAITAKPFNIADWDQFYTTAQGDTRWLRLSGGTLTGALTLSGPPTLANHATTRSYVDAGDALKLNLTGGTLTGSLILAGDPAVPLGASTKQYADTKLPLAGGTMTGPLTLSGAPTVALHATTKGYVDAADALKLNLVGGTLTGPLTLAGAPTVALHAATKAYVDALSSAVNAGYLPLTGGTVTGNITAPAFVVGSTSGYFSGDANSSVLVWDAAGWFLRYWRPTGRLSYYRGSDSVELFAIDGTGSVAAPGSISASLDLNAGRNVLAQGTVQGAYVASSGNVNAAVSVTAGQDVVAQRNVQAAGSVIAGSAPMVFGPGGDGAIMQFAPNYYWDWSSVDGSLVMISNGSRIWAIRASDAACYNNISWVGGHGAYRDVSDERLKTDIAPATVGLPEILAIDPINFHRLGSDGEPYPASEIGFSAQNVQPIIPEAVTVTGIGRPDALAVASEMILAAAVNAIKTLNERVAALEAT